MSATDGVLNDDCVYSAAVSVDWSSVSGWASFEAVTCEKCGETVVLTNGRGGAPHSTVDPDAMLPACDLAAHHGGAGPCEDCVESTGTDGLGMCMCQGAPCDGYVPLSEGPLMNYFYPCEKLTDPIDAAFKIAHLPLCVVEFERGAIGFALCAGGMDLSWHICAAYVACGYLPPVIFSQWRKSRDLYDIRGATDWRMEVLRASRKACELAAHRLSVQLEDLNELEEYVNDTFTKAPQVDQPDHPGRTTG